MHLFQVQFTMKLTHRTLPENDDDYMPELEPESEDAKLSTSAWGKAVYRLHWDDDCPWNEWYSVEDPLTASSATGSNQGSAGGTAHEPIDSNQARIQTAAAAAAIYEKSFVYPNANHFAGYAGYAAFLDANGSSSEVVG